MQKVALSHHARLEVARNAPGPTAKMKVHDKVEMQIDDHGHFYKDFDMIFQSAMISTLNGGMATFHSDATDRQNTMVVG